MPGAIIPTGGRARRLGGTPKPLLRDTAGTALLTRILRDLLDHGLRPEAIVVVGPPDTLRPAIDDLGPEGDRVHLTREEPPYSGPSAAIAAGLHTLLSTTLSTTLSTAATPPAPPDLVFTLASDMPELHSGIDALRRASAEHPDADAWIGSTPQPGAPPRLEYLFALHRTEALSRRVRATATQDLSMRRLLHGLRLHPVPLPRTAATDVDTWEAAAELGLHHPNHR